MTLTHRPFQSLVKPEVPRLPPEPEPPGEPHCRLCKRLWSAEPGLTYCVAQHGSCGLCKAPRIRCRCLAPSHWTGTRVRGDQLASPPTVPETVKSEEKPMEESPPVSDAPNPKVEFVLSHPDAPAKEVAELAEKAGLELSSGYVHQIRSDFRNGGQQSKAYAKKAGKKLTGSQARGRPPTEQTAFVRTMPIDAPIKDVLKAARAAGVKKLTHRYVVDLRGRDKREGRDKLYGKPMPASATPPPKQQHGKPGSRLRHTVDGMTKSKWIAAQPFDESRESVAKRARAAGFNCTPQHVTIVRSDAKAGRRNLTPEKPQQMALAAPAKPVVRRQKIEGRTAVPDMPRSEAEQDFMDGCMTIGIQRAAELVHLLQHHWVQLRNQLTGR